MILGLDYRPAYTGIDEAAVKAANDCFVSNVSDGKLCHPQDRIHRRCKVCRMFLHISQGCVTRACKLVHVIQSELSYLVSDSELRYLKLVLPWSSVPVWLCRVCVKPRSLIKLLCMCSCSCSCLALLRQESRYQLPHPGGLWSDIYVSYIMIVMWIWRQRKVEWQM